MARSLREKRLVCALRKGGVAYSFLPVSHKGRKPVVCICKLVRVEVGGEHFPSECLTLAVVLGSDSREPFKVFIINIIIIQLIRP